MQLWITNWEPLLTKHTKFKEIIKKNSLDNNIQQLFKKVQLKYNQIKDKSKEIKRLIYHQSEKSPDFYNQQCWARPKLKQKAH